MSKILFYTPQLIIPADGVSKKVFGQVQALKNIGNEVAFIYPQESESAYNLYLDGALFIKDMYSGNSYNNIFEYVKCNKFDILFIRYVSIATPEFLLFLSKCKNYVKKIVIEIPTYPYDGEISLTSIKQLYKTLRERLSRKFMYRWVDCVLTYSTENVIYRIPTIRISNAPAYSLPLRKARPISSPIRFIAVANIAFWHGLDRFVQGVANYYSNGGNEKMHVTIVGGGDTKIIHKLKEQVNSNGLQNIIQFVGSKDGAELTALFDNADIAIGSLGRHRTGIVQLKSLKNVEYAMRGIPFFYSEGNTDFDDKPYILRVPADDSAIDMQTVIAFVKNQRMSAEEISADVSHMTWENQFAKILNELNN